MRRIVLLSCAALLLSACNRTTPSGAKVEPAGGSGQETVPQVGPKASGPVETAPPNVPEFKPAFAGQTRAPAIRTRTKIQVTEIAGDLDHPWAIAFLPDRRMLVTEKHDGKLFIVVTPQGAKSPPVEGVPPVD